MISIDNVFVHPTWMWCAIHTNSQAPFSIYAHSVYTLASFNLYIYRHAPFPTSCSVAVWRRGKWHRDNEADANILAASTDDGRLIIIFRRADATQARRIRRPAARARRTRRWAKSIVCVLRANVFSLLSNKPCCGHSQLIEKHLVRNANYLFVWHWKKV